MNDLSPPHAGAPDGDVAQGDPLRTALLDSRQRWRDFVAMSADIAFETDGLGRFSFIDPDPALGWRASLLLGQPAELLLADTSGATGFNPFRVASSLRRRRAWIKRPDGSVCCVAFSVSPLRDARGQIMGARGIGLDVTELDRQEAQVAAALRRGEVLDHILRCMREEVLAPKMMEAALDALRRAVGGEGAAVVEVIGHDGEASLLYDVGEGATSLLPVAASMLEGDGLVSSEMIAADGRNALVCACRTRFGEQMGLVLWRRPGSRAWDLEEHGLAESASTMVRVILEHDAIQREMGRQARTDPLTGLYNRRAFLEELDRHIDRLEREQEPGTLMFLDLDYFKQLNDEKGHEVGDEALRVIAGLLRRTVRPTDIVARLGGDEFALWLNGADHLTAAERAEALRLQGPEILAHLTEGTTKPVTFSIGIATRRAGSGEEVGSVLHRADVAMYAAKRAGRANWRVAPE